MNEAYELRTTQSKGEGIYSTIVYKVGDTVMVGAIENGVDENHSHASQIGIDEFAFHGGLVTKVNHSCDPNCGIKLNATGAHNFVARKDIAVNEEITFDYAMRNYQVEHFPGDCQCGSSFCRTQITGWQDLPNARKESYLGFVAPYLIQFDKETASTLLNTAGQSTNNAGLGSIADSNTAM